MVIIQKAQSTLEYAMIIAIVAGGLIAMQIYMKRGIEGKVKESADSIGQQFDAGNTEITFTTNRSGTSVQETTTGITKVYSGDSGKGTAETSTSYGTEAVGDMIITPVVPVTP